MEATQPLHRTQGDSEEEEETDEKREEEMFRNEANQMDLTGRLLLERYLYDANRLKDEAEREGRRYRDAAIGMCEEAKRRRDAIRDSANIMMTVVTRNMAE